MLDPALFSPSWRRCALAAAVALTLIFTAGSPAQAQPFPGAGKVEQRLLRDTANGQRASAFIVLADQADLRPAYAMRDASARGWFVYQTLRDLADRTQPAILTLLGQHRAGYQRFWAVNAIVAEVDQRLLMELAGRPDVLALEANVEQRWLGPIAPEPAPTRLGLLAGPEWGVQSVGAPQVWALGYYGQGIVIANADTGMQWEHPALKGRYRGYGGIGGTTTHDRSWHDSVHGASTGNPCGGDSAVPCDDNNHGTHTTGTVIGDDGLGNQIGVAPGARWIGCRNMDRGAGTPARYTECFEFFIAPTDLKGQSPDPDLRPHVINNSWGCPTSEGCAPTALQLIVENTQAAGIFVEASAGNSGPGCGTVDSGPGSFAAAFSTGAHDATGKLVGFSSRGPVVIDGSGRQKPEIIAPGSRVRSSLPGGRYGNLSGTSMAGPHVVGVVALLWSARPELSRQIEATKQLLMASANPTVTLGSVELCGGIDSSFIPNNSFGAGKVDALAAVTW